MKPSEAHGPVHVKKQTSLNKNLRICLGQNLRPHDRNELAG
ncbi:hypothetical protein ACVWWG_005484 [Bradyrhizobium sp. LB7.2]